MGLWGLLTNKDIFPTKASLFIFVAYMLLFVSQGKRNYPIKLKIQFHFLIFSGLLVTASRQGNQTYPYNPTTVVLLTEFIKLVVSATAYVKE